MSNDMEMFMAKANEIAERQDESDQAGAELGFVYCTAQEAGVMLDPATPVHLSKARIFRRFLNTPEGHALWEQQSMDTQRKLAEITKADEPARQPQITLTSIEFST